MIRHAFLTSVVLSVAAATAPAKTIEVPEDHPSISLAAKYASPGDTIEVSSGTYFETVYIPANLAGLKIEGKGKVIVDAHPSGGAGGGDVFRVYAPNVKIENVIVRHARNGYNAFRFYADGCTLEDVTIEDCTNFGVYVSGPDLLTMEDCHISGTPRGVYLNGCNASKFEDCTFELVTEYGIYLYASQAKVTDCEFQTCGTPIFARYTPCVIADNKIVGFSGAGITVLDMSDFTVEKNELSHGQGAYGIVVDGCSGGRVEENELLGISAWAIRLDSSTNVEIHDNKITRCEVGISIGSSSANTITDNSIKTCRQDGIYLSFGNGNLVAGNEVKGCLKDGIRFKGGSGNQAIDNKVQKNGGEGLCNTASGTTWLDNTAKGNRIDLANSGSVSSSDNSFKTGGTTTKPQIED